MGKTKEIENLEYLSLEIKVLLHVISRIARQDTEKRLKKENVELSPLSFGVLCMLKKKSSTVAQLSKRMMMSSPTLVPIVDSLEKKGFVKRSISSIDRRQNLITLTEKSKRMKIKMNKIFVEDNLIKSISSLGEMRVSLLAKMLEELTISIAGVKKLSEIKAICKENALAK